MTLTKEIIEREMRIWERNGYIEGTVWARHYIDLCRLALLGLERDERAERIGRAVMRSISGMDPCDGLSDRLRLLVIDLGPDYWQYDIINAIADAMEDAP